MATLKDIYGPLFSLQLGLRPAIVVSSPKLAKEVLKNHGLVFSGRPSLHGNQKLSYNGLEIVFSPYNDYWREIRKICMIHIFSSKRVSSFASIRHYEVKQMMKKIYRHASSSVVTNLSELLISLSSTIICRIAFGRRYDNEGTERSRFHGMVNEVEAMLAIFFVSDYIPFTGWIDKLTGLHACLERIYKQMDEFYKEVIDERLHQNREHREEEVIKVLNLGPKRYRSPICKGFGSHRNRIVAEIVAASTAYVCNVKVFEISETRPKPIFKTLEVIVDVLLQLKKQRSFSFDLTYDHIKGVLMNILVAATDTTAATSVWAMTALIKNPRVMKKVQEEVRKFGGKKDFLDEDDIQKFPYLKAVIKETLRLHLPNPLLVPREANENCIINGYQIQAKTIVYINAWAIHRDPEAWKDPEEFYPERFLDSHIDFQGHDFELIPFGAGRRICPGLSMAVPNLELILANLLHSFDWELPQGVKKEDIDTEMLPGIAQHKKNPLCLFAKNHM